MAESLQVKFIFPNQDGVSVELDVNTSLTVAALKQQLFDKWPPVVEAPPDMSSIRMITMGRPLVDHKTLKESKVLKFDTHPTPINVAVRLKSMTSNAVAPATKKGGHNTSASANSAGGSGTCCIIS